MFYKNDFMKNITLTVLQRYRLLNSIKETNPKLFSDIENDTSKMCRAYASYDGKGTYCLEFSDISYIPPKIYYVSWDVLNPVHNYIFYTTRRVD